MAESRPSRIAYRDVLARDAFDQPEVFYHAVMQGAASHYSLAQRQAWAAALPREASAWAARHALYSTLVAECDGHCVGFLELDASAAQVVTLYVWPSLSHRGIGSTLLLHAERLLIERGSATMALEASVLLEAGLLRRGWTKLGEEWVERGGEALPRVRMEKRLKIVET